MAPGTDRDAQHSYPTTGRLMQGEIAEQPTALSRLLDTRDVVDEVAARVADFDPRCVVVAARGTSDHAALYLKYLVEVSLGLPVGLASLSSVTAYRSRPSYDKVLWVAVSQSGASPDLVESTRIARECGALTLAVTNTADSALVDGSEVSLDVQAGPELAVAATKTYTCELLALWLLIDFWRGGDGSSAASLPNLAAATLTSKAYAELADALDEASSIVTTGRGYAYVSAREAALKLMETTYMPAQAFSSADLLHGPMAMIAAGQPIIAFRPADPAVAETMREPLERLLAAGAQVSHVGTPLEGIRPGVVVPLPDSHPELAPVLEILPVQQAVRTLALSHGVDPDAPRSIKKVTQTW